VTAEFTLEELARAVQGWCERHRVYPANGQASEELTERTIRYYRTLGLLDPPVGNYAKTFTEKHRLQLVAIRLYQAQGLPLRKIRDELYGKSEEDLTELEKQVRVAGKKGLSVAVPFLPGASTESWSVVPLSGEFLLVDRKNRELPRSVIEKINELLAGVQTGNETTDENNRN
jgi:DNA-binding transcriptional MerR regulator